MLRAGIGPTTLNHSKKQSPILSVDIITISPEKTFTVSHQPLITFTRHGIYCPQGDFYIDPWHAVERAVVTHAHADHARYGMKNYLCHEISKPIIQSRISGDFAIEGLPYGKSVSMNGVKLSLHPAGHIIGSAQVRLEYKGYVSVVSGDYKTGDDGISTPFEPLTCNEFVTESTFGLPVFRWLPRQIVEENMRNWVIRNQQQNKTSVFTAYSLGKAQRLMVALQGLGRIYVHSAIARLNEVIIQSGVKLPEYFPFQLETDRKNFQGQIVIVPPAASDSEMIRKVPKTATAICSGWMQVRGHRRWQSADAGFAISDHADWDGLLQAVKATGAEKVHVTHGYTEPFSRYLNETGINAQVVKTRFGEGEE